MKPKTEEFLYFLLWSTESLLRPPSFRDLDNSFESWAYRNGLLRQLGTLEKHQLLERRAVTDRVYRLTEQGRLTALGGRDPVKRWARSWDGHWRLVLFDLPVQQNNRRDALRRYLRGRGFGFLQNSVWITPDPLETEREILEGSKSDVESLLLLDAKPCAGETNAEIVAGAWDFVSINRRYVKQEELLNERPAGKLRTAADARKMRAWAERERTGWRGALAADPLLPEKLLPADYLGQKVWHQRCRGLSEMGRQLRLFRQQ